MTMPYEKLYVGTYGRHKKMFRIAEDDVAQLSCVMDMMATPDEMLYKFLEDSTGGVNIASSTSGTTAAPVYHSYTVPAGKVAWVRRFNLKLTDGGITPSKFGGLAALAKGILVQAVSSGSTLMIDFTDGQNVKTNSDWGFLAGTDVSYNIVAGDDGLNVRWTLAKSGAMMFLSANETFRVGVQETMLGITDWKIMIQGIIGDALD